MATLDEAHARAVLDGEETVAAVAARVEAVLGRSLAELGATLRSGYDVDVPIPLIAEVDCWTRLFFPGGELFVRVRGEAHEHRYRLALEARIPDADTAPRDSRAASDARFVAPDTNSPAIHHAWASVWNALDACVALAPRDRVALVLACVPAVLRDDVNALLRATLARPR